MKHETSHMKCHICNVESTFAQTTCIVHVKETEFCPFKMLMKCPSNINMDVKWTYVIWHSCWCQMDSCDVHLTFTWTLNGLVYVHLTSILILNGLAWFSLDMHMRCQMDKWLGDGWEFWHVIRTCSRHGLEHDNNNVLMTWLGLWKKHNSNTHQLVIILSFSSNKS
jgi:hypothetical protein